MKSQADYIYRAFKKYREVTKDNICQREIRNISKPSKDDILEIKKYRCFIEEDWISEIEKGLVFVEKALAEERQFITSEGNTIPIEKVKKVSVESVVHLAKHSNLITHLPDDESKPVIPDALYMVEKLSDYAVYENRFLYMLLVQLKEFISMRLDKILKIRKRYICNFKFKNVYQSKVRNYTCELSFSDDRLDNPYAIDDNISNDLIRRIEDIERMVVIFLKTDIMVEVSKAQMVKPPIVKTNVLKMNNNFKKSLELYDFISTYNKEGFTYEEVVKNYCPFVDDVELEFSELTLLISNLTSKYGNEITKLLELNYQEDEERLKKEEAEKLLEQIERTKRKIRESNNGYEEYILLVEKRNKYLESANEKLILSENKVLELENKIIELDGEMNELNRRIKSLDKIIDDKNLEIIELNKEFETNINNLKEEHLNNISKLNEEFDLRIVDERKIIEDEFEEKYSIYKNDLENKINEIENLKYDIENIKNDNIEALNLKDIEYSNLINEHKKSQAELKDDFSKIENEYKNTINDLKDINKNNELKLNDEISILNDKLNICNARLHAYKMQLNVENDEDFTTKEGFDQLEKEFDFFYKFFKDEWKKTKKKIRKQLLWKKRQGKGLEPNDDVNKSLNIKDNNEADSNIENNESEDK